MHANVTAMTVNPNVLRKMAMFVRLDFSSYLERYCSNKKKIIILLKQYEGCSENIL